MRRALQIVAIVLVLILAGPTLAQVADPAPSPELAYEGRLIEAGAPVTGTRPFVFSIVDSTGTELWNSGPQTLTVTLGLYSVVLGATGMPAIPASLTLKANLHLHLLADGVALSPDISLVPSMQASTAWTVTGPFFGDISGTQQGISVDKLKGTPIDLTGGASAGQVLTFNGTSWTAATATGGTGSGTVGPQGATGPPGAMGPPGINGANGSNGVAGASPFTLDGVNAVFTTGSVGIGVDPPDSTAALDLTSTTKGFLAPRMTTVQRLAITTPANGLIVFDTNTKSLQVYDAVGLAWDPLITTTTQVSGVTSVGTTGPLTGGPITSTGTIGINRSSSAQDGYLSAADFANFLAAFSWGNHAVAGYLKADGSVPMTGSLNMGSNIVSNLAGPVAATDAANKTYVDSIAAGFIWQPAVINLLATPPPTPADGDRYIVLPGATGVWTGETNDVAQWSATSSTWSFTAPTNSESAFVTVPMNGYVFLTANNDWVQFNAASSFTFGGGLNYAAPNVSIANGGVITAMLADGSVTAPKLNSLGATFGQVMTYNGTIWAPATSTTGTVTAVTAGAPLVVTNGNTTPAISLGTVPIAIGGTGAVTANAALTNLLPIQTGNAGKVLASDGTNTAWTTGAVGSVTAVTASTPLTVTNGTTTPAITLGTVPVANGGTGATTLSGFLVGNGTGAFSSLAAIPGSAVAGDIAGNAASVNGIVPVANGGTGAATFTAGNLLFGNGTSAILSDPNLFWDNTNEVLNANGGLLLGNDAAVTPAAGTLRWNTIAQQLQLFSGGVWGAIGSGNGTVTNVTGTLPISVSGGGTTTPVIALTGTVPVANGGTGATTLTSGNYLIGAGTGAITSSATIPGAAITGNITGNAANVTGIVPIVNGGTGNAAGNAVNVTGIVAITNGGTGATSAPGAITNLLPSQTGFVGNVLTTNGSTASWSNQPMGTVTGVTGTSPINVTGTAAAPVIGLGTVSVANGGTGNTTLSGYLFGNGTGAVAAGAAIPGASILGNIAGNAANVTGTVGVASGGTGANSLTGYVVGTGTGALTATPIIPVASGGTGAAALTAGNILFGTGTTPVGVNPNLFWDNTNNLLNLAGGLQLGNYTFSTPLAGTLRWTGTALQLFSAGAWSSIGSGNGTVTGVTGTAPITVTGTTAPVIALGTVPVANGGTGATTLTGYLLGAGASAVTASSTIPASALSGTVPVANGGTGAASLTGYLLGNGTSAVTATPVIPIANGGTGATMATTAINALLPSQTGNTGTFLTTNGTTAAWSATPMGTVTSVSGTSPINVATGTTTPAITLGTVPVANGGTGATTLTTGNYLIGAGTGAITSSATIPGTALTGNITGNAANVTGTVAVANGGTGATTLTGFLSGNGAGAFTAAATIPAASVSGTLPLANGGTGATTQAGASVNILPSQTAFAGDVLETNGTSASWVAAGVGTVTSVTSSSTALAISSNNSTPNITLGTVPVANGGTGNTSLTGYLLGAGTAAVTASATIPVSALTGALPVGNGGTGATTATTAINALLPAQGAAAGQVLTTDGSSASWSAALAGTVTSVTGTAPIVVATGTSTPAISLGTVPVANGGTGATTLSGYLFGNGTGVVTASATIPAATAVSGQLPIANGGTGATTAASAILALLPAQGAFAGDVLTTNGTAASWAAPATSGTVTSVTGTSPISVASGTTTPVIALTGTVTVANGGTGVTTLAAGNVLYGNGGGGVASVAGFFWNSSSHFLGIGTSNPQVPLDVETTTSYTTPTSYEAYNVNGPSGPFGPSNAQYSLITVSRALIGAEVDVYSDARIKNILGPSDISSDLETIKKLRITDYSYIDVVNKGSEPKKGVIAQELQQVYPHAVHIISGFLPSVYAIADSAVYNSATQELTVTVPKAHGFVVGDVVRIIAGAGNVERPVAAVLSDDTFVLSGVATAPSDRVFVYGKQVDDLHVVDYDQLFTMNISATQQLASDIDALKSQVAAISDESQALTTDNLSVTARLAALEAVVAALQQK